MEKGVHALANHTDGMEYLNYREQSRARRSYTGKVLLYIIILHINHLRVKTTVDNIHTDANVIRK